MHFKQMLFLLFLDWLWELLVCDIIFREGVVFQSIDYYTVTIYWTKVSIFGYLICFCSFFPFFLFHQKHYHKELGEKSLYRTCNFLFLSYFEKWTCRISKLHLTKLPSRNVPVSTPVFHWERVHCSQAWSLSIFKKSLCEFRG